MLGLGVGHPSAGCGPSEASAWRVNADLESEVCSLRAAADATQRCLVQLESKLMSRIEQTCQRQIEDTLSSRGPLADVKQSFAKLQSEQRHLSFVVGQLPAARDVDTVLEQHRSAIETRLGERIEAIEHSVAKQQHALAERLETRGGETWRTCLQRMSALEERAVLQTDVTRIIERALAEVRRAGPELLGGAASGTAGAVADVRTTVRRLEAKVAGCEARLAGVSEDTCAEGRVWRAHIAAQVETLGRANHDLGSRLIGFEAAQTAWEQSARKAAESAEATACEAKEQAEDALAAAQRAEAEVGKRAEAIAHQTLEALETALNTRIDTLRRDFDTLRLQVQGQDQSLQAAKADNVASARERAAALDSLATLRAEVAQHRASSSSAVSSLRDSMQSEFAHSLSELRHDIQVRLAKVSGTSEAEASRLAATISALERRVAAYESYIAELAAKAAKLESTTRALSEAPRHQMSGAAMVSAPAQGASTLLAPAAAHVSQPTLTTPQPHAATGGPASPAGAAVHAAQTPGATVSHGTPAASQAGSVPLTPAAVPSRTPASSPAESTLGGGIARSRGSSVAAGSPPGQMPSHGSPLEGAAASHAPSAGSANPVAQPVPPPQTETVTQPGFAPPAVAPTQPAAQDDRSDWDDPDPPATQGHHSATAAMRNPSASTEGVVESAPGGLPPRMPGADDGAAQLGLSFSPSDASQLYPSPGELSHADTSASHVQPTGIGGRLELSPGEIQAFEASTDSGFALEQRLAAGSKSPQAGSDLDRLLAAGSKPPEVGSELDRLLAAGSRPPMADPEVDRLLAAGSKPPGTPPELEARVASERPSPIPAPPAAGFGDDTSIDQASALANVVLQQSPDGADHAAHDDDGGSNWDDDNDDVDADGVLAGLGFDDDDQPPTPSGRQQAQPAPPPATTSGPAPVGSFGSGPAVAGIQPPTGSAAPVAAAGPAPLGSFGSGPPAPAAGPAPLGSYGSGPPVQDDDGDSNWDDDDDGADAAGVLAGLGFDDDDAPGAPSGRRQAQPAPAAAPGPAPVGSFGSGPPAACAGPAPVGSFGSGPPAAPAGPGPVGSFGSGPPGAAAGPAPIGSFGSGPPVAAPGPAPVGPFGSGPPPQDPSTHSAAAAAAPTAPPTAGISGAAGTSRFSSLGIGDAQDDNDDLLGGASFDDDADIPLEASNSWDVSGGQGSFDRVSAHAAQAAAAARAAAAQPAQQPSRGSPTGMPARAQPASASTPAAAIPAAPKATAQEKNPPSSARMMADMGFSSDDAPADDKQELSSDWD